MIKRENFELFKDDYYGELLIVINEKMKSIYDDGIISVDFSVYEIEDMDAFKYFFNKYPEGFDDYLYKDGFIFSCDVSYKNAFPYFGEEKESCGKYHYQLGTMDDVERLFNLIPKIIGYMKKKHVDYSYY